MFLKIVLSPELSPFPEMFAKAFFLTVIDTGIEYGIDGLTHSHTMRPFDAPGKQAF